MNDDITALNVRLVGAGGEQRGVVSRAEALAEAKAAGLDLVLVAAEGLSERWQRHRSNAEVFWRGLGDIGLEPFVAHANRLPSLTTVKVPQGVCCTLDAHPLTLMHVWLG